MGVEYGPGGGYGILGAGYWPPTVGPHPPVGMDPHGPTPAGGAAGSAGPPYGLGSSGKGMLGGGYCPGGTGPGGGYGAPGGGQADPGGGGGKGAGAPGGREGYIPVGGGPKGTVEADVLGGNPAGAAGGAFGGLLQGLEAGQACGGCPGCCAGFVVPKVAFLAGELSGKASASWETKQRRRTPMSLPSPLSAVSVHTYLFPLLATVL